MESAGWSGQFGATRPTVPSGISLLVLVRPLARVEELWFTYAFTGLEDHFTGRGIRARRRELGDRRICTVLSHRAVRSSAILSINHPDPRLRSGLIADAPSPRQNRRLELPFSFQVLAA